MSQTISVGVKYFYDQNSQAQSISAVFVASATFIWRLFFKAYKHLSLHLPLSSFYPLKFDATLQSQARQHSLQNPSLRLSMHTGCLVWTLYSSIYPLSLMIFLINRPYFLLGPPDGPEGQPFFDSFLTLPVALLPLFSDFLHPSIAFHASLILLSTVSLLVVILSSILLFFHFQ